MAQVETSDEALSANKKRPTATTTTTLKSTSERKKKQTGRDRLLGFELG